MTDLITLLKKSEFGFFLLVVVLNSLLILFLYKSVFSLEIQGDTWQYAYNQEFAYGNSLLTQDSIRSLKTSLGGSFLIFSLIKLIFGLNSFAYYTISVIFKFLTVISAYLFIKKLTQNRTSALIASLFLSATFIGTETTHWVFNMYAYVGLTFITLGLSVGLSLPQKFDVARWLTSFLLVAIGIWVGPMRTNGIMLVVLAWSLYKVFLLRSADSRKNFFYWLGGFIVLYFIYRNYLGLFEPDYAQYILDQWWMTFHRYTSIAKYDFLLSPVSNVGRILLPDIWLSSINFYQKFFPIFGLTNFRAILVPMFLIFILLSFILSRIGEAKNRIFQQMSILGFFWSALVTVVYKQGPPNFPSWQDLIFTLWGGYFLAWCTSFIISLRNINNYLRDIFFFSFFWSFSFVLVPIVLNGGNVFGTLHRYFAVTALSVPLFVGGVLSQVFSDKKSFPKFLVLSSVLVTIVLHGFYTKSFFDHKAKLHNRVLVSRIWRQFTQIVPNKQQYAEINPIIWFDAGSDLDKEILFESLFFGLPFRTGYLYGWRPDKIWGFYFENWETLIADVKKNPKILDEFYAIKLENAELVDTSKETKKSLLYKIKNPLSN